MLLRLRSGGSFSFSSKGPTTVLHGSGHRDVCHITRPQFLAFPSTVNTSFSAIPRLTHGWKSWRAHCLTFALDNRHYKTDCRFLLQCSVTYSRPKALRRRYQDVGQLEVKLSHSEHPLNPTTKFDYCKVDKILNLTEGSCLESFTSFNRLSKSASSPDCPNLPILSQLTAGGVRDWQDILLKVFES